MDNLKERCEALTLAFATTGSVRAGSAAISTSYEYKGLFFDCVFQHQPCGNVCACERNGCVSRFQPTVITAKATTGFYCRVGISRLILLTYLLTYTAMANA